MNDIKILWNLRQNCCIGSLYLKDYTNQFSIDTDDLFYFFDGYLEYLEDLMYSTVPNFTDSKFFNCINDYDISINLYNYYLYYCSDYLHDIIKLGLNLSL